MPDISTLIDRAAEQDVRLDSRIRTSKLAGVYGVERVPLRGARPAA